MLSTQSVIRLSPGSNAFKNAGLSAAIFPPVTVEEAEGFELSTYHVPSGVSSPPTPAGWICQIASLLFARNTLLRSVTRLYSPLLAITMPASESAEAQSPLYKYTLDNKAWAAPLLGRMRSFVVTPFPSR